MPVYNGALTISDSIQSVMDQDYENFELIIVNDGSTDDTERLIREISDARITLISQKNGGVSSARNAALDIMKGDFFCFLDADDLLPVSSISSRLKKFEESNDIWYVDGVVKEIDSEKGNVIRTYEPTFKGTPQRELLLLSGACFCGQTWMIKNTMGNKTPRFEVGRTHGEDLLFLLECSKLGGSYNFVEDEILHYNRRPDSAMSDIKGLELFYRNHLSRIAEFVSRGILDHKDVRLLKKRIRRILFRSYIKKGNIVQAIKQCKL